MTKGQWTVAGMLTLLLGMEALLHPAIAKFFNVSGFLHLPEKATPGTNKKALGKVHS